MKILAVIPARGGSKGIPRKNMRLMNGKPLISYSINNALLSSYIDDVIVSSDSDEIISYVKRINGVSIMRRSDELAGDKITLDPVIFEALSHMEAQNKKRYDIVVTLQPTSPLISVDVLDNALSEFISSDADSMISVVNSPHLSWSKDSSGRIIPKYTERLNRQQLPPNYIETGAFFISGRDYVTPTSRLGDNTTVFEVPEFQAIDIDTEQDWVISESILKRRRIAFRVDGYAELGMGHVYRALSLAYEMIGNEIIFICDSRYGIGIDKLRSANMNVVEINNDDDLLKWLEDNKVDIFINDLLDTDKAYIESIKLRVGKVVTFEDMGDGAREADIVINAIYEGASPHTNVYSGQEYVCLRDEFLSAGISAYHDDVSRVLVTFGGTDPLNLTKRLYAIAQQWNNSEKRLAFDFILGPGYSDESISSIPDLDINVVKNVARISDYMLEADIAFSSQGRTTFELASIGVPTIVIAQNERELLHTFAQMNNGFINLGLGTEVSDQDVLLTLKWIIGANSIRQEMRNRMLRNDLRSGVRRVKELILGDI